MTIRTILAAVSGGGATIGAVELACRLARRFEAHLEGFHVLPDPRAVFAATGEGLGPASASLAECVMEEAVAKATEARAMFEDIVARHDIRLGGTTQTWLRGPAATWRQISGNAATEVARHARFFDLAVLGRSDRVIHQPHSDTIEETLLYSGRPVLLAPTEAPALPGGSVAVAWNGSPPAVRAMTAALPFLERVEAVMLLTAGDDNGAGLLYAIEYLAWHGIKAEPKKLARHSGRQLGGALIEAARDAGADMLVMGGYSHSPWREQLFGGATRATLNSTAPPLLLMH